MVKKNGKPKQKQKPSEKQSLNLREASKGVETASFDLQEAQTPKEFTDLELS